MTIAARRSAVAFLAASPCGAAIATLGEAVAHLRPSGALWIEAARVLIAADLHFEKGSAYASRGQLLPPYDTAETLRRLAVEAEALSPRAIVMLGDALHDERAEARLAPADRASLQAIARGRSLIWVAGNHDAAGPGGLPGEAVDELALGGLVLRHEPLPGAQPGEVAGHLHPCARVVGRGRAVRRRCFITDGERMVLPAFGAYAGGLNIRDPA